MAKAQVKKHPSVDVKIKIIGTLGDARLIKKIFRAYFPNTKSLNEKSSIESYISMVEYAEKRAKQDEYNNAYDA